MMSYSIDQVRHEGAITEMLPHVVLPDGTERSVFAAQFVMTLRQDPDRLLVIQARDDQNELVGFVIAENMRGEFVHLAQAWSHQDNPWSVINDMFLRVVLWAASMGKEGIRAETTRGTYALQRRFGFVERNVNIQYNIDPDILTKVIENMRSQTNG